MDTPLVRDANFIYVTATKDGEKVIDAKFGVCGATPWKLCGPFWRTEPFITTEGIEAHMADAFPYKAIVEKESKLEGNLCDKKRHFHLNFYPDNEYSYIDEKELFTPLFQEQTDINYIQSLANVQQDSFRLDDFFGFRGPCTAYFSRIILMEEEEEVFLQVGHTCPFKLYINDELVAERSHCDSWTAENVHKEGIKLRKGENRIVFKVTRVNDDAKFNVTFARGWTCATHVTGLVSKNPYCF